MIEKVEEVSPHTIEKFRKRWSDFDAYARQYEGGVGIPVGCEGIDYRWKADLILKMLGMIEEGMPPKEINKRAKEISISWIKIHNSRRKDYTWHRWEGCCGDLIDDFCASMEGEGSV